MVRTFHRIDLPQKKFAQRPAYPYVAASYHIELLLSSTYGLETVVSVLLTNTHTRWPHNEREIFNTARGVASRVQY